MPRERTTELVNHLRNFYKAGTKRQMDLATSLDLSRQQLAEILSGRNNPTSEQALTIQDFLKANSMSTPVSNAPARHTSTDDDEVDYMSTEKHASWGQTSEALSGAQQEIIRLRAELKSMPAATSNSSHVVLPTPPPKPAVQQPASPPPATKPTTEGVERAMTMLANTSVDDLIAGIKTARAEGNLKAVGVIQAELESRVVTSSSNKRSDTLGFDVKDPKTWSGKIGATAFPVNCDNPKAIGEYLSTLSTEALRSHLKGAPASAMEQLQQKLAFAELQNRKSSR